MEIQERKIEVNSKPAINTQEINVALKMDIPGGLTRLFRSLWSTSLCKQSGKSEFIINKLIWSPCCGINCLQFRNVVVTGSGMSVQDNQYTSIENIRIKVVDRVYDQLNEVLN